MRSSIRDFKALLNSRLHDAVDPHPFPQSNPILSARHDQGPRFNLFTGRQEQYEAVISVVEKVVGERHEGPLCCRQGNLTFVVPPTAALDFLNKHPLQSAFFARPCNLAEFDGERFRLKVIANFNSILAVLLGFMQYQDSTPLLRAFHVSSNQPA